MRTVAFVVGFVVLLAVGCGGDGEDEAGRFDGAWVLASGSSVDGEVPIVEGYRITLTLEGDGVGGTAACNLYGGDVEIDGGDWRLGELSWTERGCEPVVMASEQAYLAALAAVDSVARDGEQLVLSGGGAELRFDELPPIPTAELVGTLWELDTLIEGDAASSAVGEPATLELRDDGTLAGSTGCRSLTGTYVVSGDEVVSTNLAADGNCPPDLRRQDDHVVTVIGDGFRAAIDGDRLRLTSEGDLGLGYRVPNPTPTATLQPAATATPTATSAATERRTGVPEIDLVIEAVLGGQTATLVDLVEFQLIGCTTASGLGGPPKCEEEQQTGDEVQVFPVMGCEGSWTATPGETIGTLVERSVGLYAAVEAPPERISPEWPIADTYVVLHIQQSWGPSAARIHLAGGRIVLLWWLCTPAQRAEDLIADREGIGYPLITGPFARP